MERRRSGQAGLTLSVLGLGCWSFGGGEYWGECRQQDVNAVVRRSLELGIDYFDTAEAYNAGRSEEALGRALQGLPREQLVIGTKVSPSNCYAHVLPGHCEASLRRLGLDYIDLYMIHWPIHPHSIRHFTSDQRVIEHPPTVEEAFAALSRLREAGKIRYIGVSNFGAARLEEALALCPDLVVNELPYSLLTRAVEREIFPRCRAHGLGVIAYMVLLQGILAEAYANLDDVPAYQRRTRHFDARRSALARHGEEGAEAETAAALAAIRRTARECGMTTAELASKWALACPDITCCLVGTRSVRKLEENVWAATGALPPEIVDRLNTVTQPVLDTLGLSFDYYESVSNDRTR